VSANVREALLPSDEVTVKAEPDAETPRSVETFVFLAVLAATAVSKLAIFGIAIVPVNVGLAIGAFSANAVVTVLA
jgi:hypothetical protein